MVSEMAYNVSPFRGTPYFVDNMCFFSRVKIIWSWFWYFQIYGTRVCIAMAIGQHTTYIAYMASYWSGIFWTNQNQKKSELLCSF